MIHKIGLGSVQFGLPYGISNLEGQTSIEEVSKILDIAHGNGISIIDTASGYGTAEKVIGLTNNNRFSVVSKFMPSNSAMDIRSQLENSITLLNADHLYAYLAHRPLDLLANPHVWEELQNIKSDNKVKKIGFSLNSPDECFKLLNAGMKPDVVQVPFNYFDTRFSDVLKKLKGEGCEVHTRSAFLQGLFFSDTQKLSPFFDEMKPMLNYLHKTYSDELEGVLLGYVLQQEFIDFVIIGVENSTQLTKNLQSIACAPELEPLKFAYSDKLLMPMHWPKN